MTTQTVTVLVNGDLLDELNETFFVNLSAPSNATLGDGQGLGTITDDDPEPSLSVNDVTVNEANDATFTVTLSTASGRTVTVDYATADGTATWVSHTLEETDYGQAGGTLTFLAGQTSKTVTVDVHDGNHHEVGETFFLNLTNASGASISDAQGVATIIDNDPAPEVTIDDVVLNEGDGELSFTLLKSAQTGAPATVDYTTTSGPRPRRPTSRQRAERSPSAGLTPSRTSPCRSPTTPSTRAPRRSRSHFRTRRV